MNPLQVVLRAIQGTPKTVVLTETFQETLGWKLKLPYPGLIVPYQDTKYIVLARTVAPYVRLPFWCRPGARLVCRHSREPYVVTGLRLDDGVLKVGLMEATPPHLRRRTIQLSLVCSDFFLSRQVLQDLRPSFAVDFEIRYKTPYAVALAKGQGHGHFWVARHKLESRSSPTLVNGGYRVYTRIEPLLQTSAE